MKVKRFESSHGAGYGFKCPGCDYRHMPYTERTDGLAHPCWGFNGDLSRPTFTPSILVTYDGPDAGVDDAPPAICHSFVTEGRIRFLPDCTHALSGQTVELPEIEP